MNRFHRSSLNLRAFVVVLLCLALASCGDASLKTIAQAELDVTTGVAAAQKTVESLYAQGSISADDARAVSTILLKITQANTSAAAITKNLNTLDPANRQALRDILTPLITAVSDGIAQGVLPIQNQTARTSIMAVLTTVVTSLNIIQSALNAQPSAKK